MPPDFKCLGTDRGQVVGQGAQTTVLSLIPTSRNLTAKQSNLHLRCNANVERGKLVCLRRSRGPVHKLLLDLVESPGWVYHALCLWSYQWTLQRRVPVETCRHRKNTLRILGQLAQGRAAWVT